MFETRNTYGYGRSRATDKDTLKKYQVCYTIKGGGFGAIGYRLFTSKEEAISFGEDLKRDNAYIDDIIIRHPNAIYSNY